MMTAINYDAIDMIRICGRLEDAGVVFDEHPGLANKLNNMIGHKTIRKTGVYKKKTTDTIFWKKEKPGYFYFSFDGSKFYDLLIDYPSKLTNEQKNIFDKENPEWKAILEEL